MKTDKQVQRGAWRKSGMAALAVALFMGCGAGSFGIDPTGSGGTPGAPGGPNQTPGSQPAIGTVYTGEGTFYGADGSGNCSYDRSPGNLMVAAMNNPQYANSSVCGMCVDVTGPKGKITVRIVDRCPECKWGDLDLSKEAFVQIADEVQGRVKISWTQVACAVSGPLSYRYKEGSSQWWMGVQVLNSRLPIKRIEMQKNGSWTDLQQQQYGYYLDPSNPGVGPFTFRLTSTDDKQVTETDVKLSPSGIVPGSQQF